jgi:hypothetical protein
MRDVLETIAVERIEDRLDELEGASRHSARHTIKPICDRIDAVSPRTP